MPNSRSKASPVIAPAIVHAAAPVSLEAMHGMPIRMPRELTERLKIAPFSSMTFGGRGGLTLRRGLFSIAIESIAEHIDLFGLHIGDVLHIYLAPDTRDLCLRAEQRVPR